MDESTETAKGKPITIPPISKRTGEQPATEPDAASSTDDNWD
jgi:hypothetical protein